MQHLGYTNMLFGMQTEDYEKKGSKGYAVIEQEISLRKGCQYTDNPFLELLPIMFALLPPVLIL